MPKEVPELLLLDAIRNYRERFEMRFANFSDADRLATASALLECSKAMSKHLGKMPDNIMFARPVFTREQAGQLMTALHELHEQAEQKNFGPGTTAVIALQAMATLILLGHEATFASTRKAHEREIIKMGVHVETMLQIHQAAGE